MKLPIIALFFGLLTLCLSAPRELPAEDTPTPAPTPRCLPRAEKPPAIDGDLSDPCWTSALHLTDFTLPQSGDAPAQPIEARLCFDDQALYVALTCFEKTPAKITANKTADHGDVWMDDCVELFLRAVGDSSEFDQFILNTLSVQSTHRVHPDNQPGGKDQPFKTSWTAKARVAADRWTAEFAIPFSNLGLHATPAPGHTLQLKLGREDRAGGLPPTAQPGDVTCATWPPRSRYAHAEDFATLFFLTDNLLLNADFTAAGKNGQGFARWSADLQGADLQVFTATTKTELHIAAPGHYVAISQSLKLPAGVTRFRLHCETKGAGSAYLRARVKLDPNEKNTRALTVELPPSDDWTAHDLAVPASLDGEALIILGVNENNQGALDLRNLRLTAEHDAPYQGSAIPVPANPNTPFVIEVLAPTDCRNLRGFIGAPIDGTTNSLGWDAGYWEYNRPGAGQGVGYAYNNSDGLHLTLPDAHGIDALQIHGGVHADLVADAKTYDDPASGTKIATLPGHTQHTLALLTDPADPQKTLAATKLSFFHVSDGYIADLNLFRYGPHATRQAKDLGAPQEHDDFLAAESIPGPGDPAWIRQRFPTVKNTCSFVVDNSPGHGLPAPLYTLTLAPDKTIHIATRPQNKQTALSAVGLTATLENCAPGTLLQLQLQDPLAPRTAITTVVVALPGNGPLNLVLDIPDLILPANTNLWLTISAPTAKLTLAQPNLALYTTPREKALAPALAYRLTKLQGFYAAMSEARPWNSLHSRTQDVDAWIDENKQFRVQLREIKDAIEYCHALDPQNDIATQYYNWFYRFNKKPPLNPPVLPTPATHPEVAGAPDWAVAARAAWLTARQVPLWWIDHRSVPTGELGGEVGDDTDQFQNYAGFPLFQRTGPTAKILDCAERLAETAEKRNLRAGLNRITMDPLHAYEEGVNHEALMLWWHYGDPLYFERCLTAAKSLESLTTVNAAGHRHFKNQDCGAQDLDFDRPLGVDGFAHNQMLHPLFEVLWYNRNPRALKFVREWGDAWLTHQQPGKYAGLVDVKSDQPVADSISTEPFSSGYGGQLSAFCFLTHVTGDARYLQPLKDWLAAGNGPGGGIGALPELYQAGLLADLPAAILKNLQAKSPALRWMATGDKTAFVAALQNSVAEIQTFRHLYTTAEPFTDRIFLYPLIDPSVAYTGGYATRNKFWHSHAVSYEGFGDDYAALVRTCTADRLEVLLYNFSDQPVTGTLRTWLLDHGDYVVEQGIDGDGDDQADPVEADRTAGPRVAELAKSWPLKITLPPRKVTVLVLRQTKKLDRIEDRADLALSPLEVRLNADGTVSGVAHNIGSQDAKQVVVELYDADLNLQARIDVGDLPAPKDLTPSRAPFVLKPKLPVPAEHAKWAVRISGTVMQPDPNATGPEITGENNVVELP